MRNCYCCNSLIDSKNILNLELNLVNDINLDNNIIILFCQKCYFYFAQSKNSQEDYDNYYINFNSYADGITTVDKTEKTINFLLNNLINYNIIDILDYGCGNGMISDKLKEKFNVELYDIGMEENNNKFDCLIISHVLEHIYDLDTFISKLDNNLNEEGMIYIEIPNAEYYKNFKNLCPLQEINLEHINFFSKYALSKLMIKHNFIPLKVEDDYFLLNDIKYYVIRSLFKKNINNNSFINYINDGLNDINLIKFNNINNLYLYGCGQFLFKIYKNFENCNIINIVDDKSCYLGKKINNTEIINFEIFKNKVKDGDNVIITSTISFQKIFEKISKLEKKINIITNNI
jgi:SAM-dependent methyltransferase